MPLPSPPAAVTVAAVDDGPASTRPSPSSLRRGEAYDVDLATPTAEAGGSETSAIGEGEGDEVRGVDSVAPEGGGLGTLVKSVQASAAVRRFALATWRGAANRDGFVLDIDRCVDWLVWLVG